MQLIDRVRNTRDRERIVRKHREEVKWILFWGRSGARESHSRRARKKEAIMSSGCRGLGPPRKPMDF